MSTHTSPSKKRLMRDFRRLQNDPPHGIKAAPLQNDIMNWEAMIFGPSDSPWKDGTFKLTLSFTREYPNKAPKVKFVTKMFHPNIYNDGAICLDILQHNWSPIYDIAAILTSIQSLLTDPNPNSPANVEAAKLYQENRREYERRVQQVVEESWEQDSDDDNEEDDDDEDDNDEDDNDDDSDDLDLSDDDDEQNNNNNNNNNRNKSKTSNDNNNNNNNSSNETNVNDEKEDIDVATDGNANNANNNNNNNNNGNDDNSNDVEMNANNNGNGSGVMASAANS